MSSFIVWCVQQQLQTFIIIIITHTHNDPVKVLIAVLFITPGHCSGFN